MARETGARGSPTITFVCHFSSTWCACTASWVEAQRMKLKRSSHGPVGAELCRFCHRSAGHSLVRARFRCAILQRDLFKIRATTESDSPAIVPCWSLSAGGIGHVAIWRNKYASFQQTIENNWHEGSRPMRSYIWMWEPTMCSKAFKNP